MATRAQKRTNIVVARVVPPVLLGIVTYASYTITKPLCIDYLLHPLPSYNIHSRVGAGAAILAIYYVLLIAMVATYCRLLYTVLCNTGYLLLGPERIKAEAEKSKRNNSRRSRTRKHRRTEKLGDDIDMENGVANGDRVDLEHGLANGDGDLNFGEGDLNLDSFCNKDVYVCQEDGRPPYCSKCCQFKVDRSHHCREVDRCVRKMDHFCPWVGGVVAENSFKFFIQFVAYTALFCAFTIIVSAYFIAELSHRNGTTNAHWIVCIALASFFGFFSGGMTLSAVQMAMLNTTTIESLNKRTHVWTLAVRVPEPLLDRLWVSDSPWTPTFKMVTYPPKTPAATPPQSQTGAPVSERKVFAILHTKPGDNPFDLGFVQNMQQVMGYSILDWLLPLRHSPCTDHSSRESDFPLGPVVSRLKQEAGLASPSPAGRGSGA